MNDPKPPASEPVASAPAPAVESQWGPELAELAERRRMAKAMGGEAAIARHKARGRMTARARSSAALVL